MPGDRVVPDAPGWWWRDDGGGMIVVEVCDDAVIAGALYVYDGAGWRHVEDDGRWIAPVTPHDEVERLRAEIARLTALVDQRPRPRVEWDSCAMGVIPRAPDLPDRVDVYWIGRQQDVDRAVRLLSDAGYDVDAPPPIPTRVPR